MDSPYARPGRRVEVEGVELEEEERSMTGWCQVRRKRGQEEKEKLFSFHYKIKFCVPEILKVVGGAYTPKIKPPKTN